MRSTANNDLGGYEEWLLERRLAEEYQLAHFRRWVNRFLYLRASRPRETWQDTLTVFLEDLGAGQFLPWQVRQAGDAVTLYCGQFRAHMGTPASPKGPTREGGVARGEGSRRASPEKSGGVDAAGAGGGAPGSSPSSRAGQQPPPGPEPGRCAPAADEEVLTHCESW